MSTRYAATSICGGVLSTTLRKRATDNWYLVDAPIVPALSLHKHATAHEYGPACDAWWELGATPDRYLIAAAGCMATFLRRECGYGGTFDIDETTFSHRQRGRHAIHLHGVFIDDTGYLVTGMAWMTRIGGERRQFDWELSAIYMLPRARGSASLLVPITPARAFLEMALARHGGFYVQAPLSHRMQSIVARHGTLREKGWPYMGTPQHVPAPPSPSTTGAQA